MPKGIFYRSPKFIKKYCNPPSQKGEKRSKDFKKKVSKTCKKAGVGKWMKGKKFSIEIRKKISKEHKGNKHWNWQGGISKENERIRKSLEFKLWREAIFERDNYTCWICGEKGGRLHSHHIFSFAEYPELRFAINNGITLCKKCHKIYTKFGGGRPFKKNGKKPDIL